MMRFLVVAGFAAALFAGGPVRGQTPAASVPPENLAAARELLGVMKFADQFKAILPTMLATLKDVYVQNRPELEKQYDAMMPMFQKQAMQRINELTDAAAVIYARNFTVDEMHDIAAFYRTTTGQKFRELTPTISAQSLEAGKQFGREVGEDVKKQMGQQPN